VEVNRHRDQPAVVHGGIIGPLIALTFVVAVRRLDPAYCAAFAARAG
jgi:hypothetical protein